MTNELITVCITTFNRKAALQQSIQSVLRQTYTNFELIIVDDFSTDGTQQLFADDALQQDPRVKYIRHDFNQGLAAARNTAINNAKGKYFTFVDDDDRWDEAFLNTFLEVAQGTQKKTIFCASKISRMTENPVKSMGAELRDLLYLGFTPPVASQFYVTEEIRQIGGYELDIKSGVDHDLWIAFAAANFNIVWINQTLTRVNDIPSEARMTFNFEKRTSGIKNSLEVWQRKYSNNFKPEFFTCLAKNYKYNTHKKFVRAAFKNFEFLGVLKHISSLPLAFFFKDLGGFISARIGAKSVLERPTFQSCLNRQGSKVLYKKIAVLRENKY